MVRFTGRLWFHTAFFVLRLLCWASSQAAVRVEWVWAAVTRVAGVEDGDVQVLACV